MPERKHFSNASNLATARGFDTRSSQHLHQIASAGGGEMRRLAFIPILGIAVLLAGQAPASGQTPKVGINAPKLIHVEPAEQSAFPVPIVQVEALPRNAFLRIRGLPPSATLSDGRQIVGGSWAVPLSALSTLTITVPAGSEGEAEIAMSIETVDGRMLAAAKSTLLIAPAERLADDPSKRSAPVTTGAATRETGTPAEQTPASIERQLTPELKAQAEKYVQRGDESIAGGNISVARMFYRRAAEMGLAQGALSLAATFDANELSRWTVIGGVKPDPEQARQWYEKALALGSTDAAARLQRLSAR